MSLASNGCGDGALALSRARTYYLGALLCMYRVLSLAKVYSLRQISSTPPPPEGGAVNLYWSLGEPI